MVGKQKKIITDTLSVYTDTIAGLHYHVPEIGYTLCQVHMSMRSASNPETQLFMAVDERMWGTYAVSFTVHKDRFAEANSLVPLLSVVLEAKFGPRSWEWFTDSAKSDSQGYVYDTETGQLRNTAEVDQDESSIESDTANEFVQELTENLHLTDTSNTFDLDLTFVLDEEAHPTNQYGDTGSVRSFRSSCQPNISIELESSDKEDETSKGARANQANTDSNKPNKPSDMSINTDTSNTEAQETSTITDSTLNTELAFEKMCLQNPEFLLQFLQSNPQSTIGESATPTNQTDPHNAYPNVEGNEAAS
jgi:hypothetical protein